MNDISGSDKFTADDIERTKKVVVQNWLEFKFGAYTFKRAIAKESKLKSKLHKEKLFATCKSYSDYNLIEWFPSFLECMCLHNADDATMINSLLTLLENTQETDCRMKLQ